MYKRCPRRATITGNSLPKTPRERTNKSRQTVRKTQTKETQSKKLLLPQRGDYNARQDPLATTIKQRTDQNTKTPRSE